MPLHSNANTGMSIQGSIIFGSFPVIKEQSSSLISRYQKLSIVAEVQSTGVSSTKVTSYFLGPYPSEIATFILVNYNLVIRRLSRKVLTIWVHGSGCNCMHLRLRNMLNNYRNSEFPNEQFFIIRTTHKFIILYEGYRINGS